jgi:hypothetical protein
MLPYFSAAAIGSPVALSASGRNYRGTKGEARGRFKKESGEAKGEVGGSSARGCIHVGRFLQIGRHRCKSKDNSMVAVRIRVCDLALAWPAIGIAFALFFPKSYGPRRNSPATSDTTNNTRKMKNRTFAISAAPAAMPPNPNTAAISATTKNTSA